MFTSRVERSIAAAHHNGSENSRCYTNHGHTWKIVVGFIYDIEDLDEWGWGPDFGEIKKIIDFYDHKDLNTELYEPPSAENFARFLFMQLSNRFSVDPQFVQVFEGSGNSVTFQP